MRNRWFFLLPLAAVCLFAAGCGSWFKDTMDRVPQEKRGEYELVERRCGQCHGLDKMHKWYKRSTERLDWELLVEEMSREEGSRILPTEHERLTDLLYQWSQLAPN